MTRTRAREIAEAASHGLPLQSVDVNAIGIGVATYTHFERPGYVTLMKRYKEAGGRTVRFNFDGRQTEIQIYFMEMA